MHITISYRGIPKSPGWAAGDCMVRAFRALGHEAIPFGRFYKCGVPMAPVPHETNLLFMMECNDDDPQYSYLLEDRFYKMYWEFDTTMHLEFTKQWLLMGKYQRVFLANPTMLEELPGTEYMPYGVDTELFKPGKEEPAKGAVIVGHPFAERIEFAKKAGIDIVTNVYNHDYVAELQKHKISVHNHASGGNGLLVMRIWETMACGALLLTEEDPTLLKHFTPGIHCVTYTSPEDCREKAEYYLKNEDERKKIAQAGLEEIRKNHSYICRAKRVLSTYFKDMGVEWTDPE